MSGASAVAQQIARTLRPLDGSRREYDPLLDAIGDSRFVLLGEPSHGSHEVYLDRVRITQRLIAERGFDAVVVEADWPDTHRVDDFIKGRSRDLDADAALMGFAGRFPAWMWRNRDVLAFVEWMRLSAPHASFYGMDLYGMYASIDAVLRYLDTVDASAAARARQRYDCFRRFGGDTSRYASQAGLGIDEDCERQAVEQLKEMRARSVARLEDEGVFSAEQNARLVCSAETYYRNMFAGSVATWNLRDRHMADTIGAIVGHLDHRLGRPCRLVVWAHNSHLGDARATEMGESGELNVGQLMRERHGRDAFLVGFTTYDGTVTAASSWDQPPELKRVRPAIEGSFEALFHEAGVPRFVLLPDEDRRLPSELRHERLERAIGVVYRPQTERASHWFRARLADQFDAVVHLDRTSAVEPLEKSAGWTGGEAPETYPFAV